MWGPWGKKKDPGSALNPWSGTWESIFLTVPQRQTPSLVWEGFLTYPHLRSNNSDGSDDYDSGSEQTSCQVVSHPMERPMCEHVDDDLWPTSSEDMKPSAQWPTRN